MILVKLLCQIVNLSINYTICFILGKDGVFDDHLPSTDQILSQKSKSRLCEQSQFSR